MYVYPFCIEKGFATARLPHFKETLEIPDFAFPLPPDS